jgi:acyl-coenzyme A synthetase/AMP-(fatty) acid ligase
MKGCRGKPEASAEAVRGGWLYTGGLAQTGEDCYITLVDRKVEVEGALVSYPDSPDCAVVGVPHPDYKIPRRIVSEEYRATPRAGRSSTGSGRHSGNTKALHKQQRSR